MAKNDLPDFDADTPGNNTDIASASIAENQLPSSLNDSLRALCSIVKRAVGNKGSDISSGATTAIAAAGTSLYAIITGTTTITAFGTVAAGTFRIIEFSGALTLTHNATSLILPGSANITTAAGDVAFMISLGSGNWKCLTYQTQSGSVVGGFSSLTATSTDAGATAGPDIKAFRNSASPADNDLIGRLLFSGRDESANEDTYASIEAQILDATGGTEDALLLLKTVVAGTLAARLSVGQGLVVGATTGGDPGAGAINATTYEVAGIALANLPLQILYNQVQGPQSGVTAVIPADDTSPLVSEGTELFSQAVTPKTATSKIVIEGAVTWGGSGAGTDVVLTLYSGTTLLAVWSGENPSNGATSTPFFYEETSGSTSARTYSLRYGPTAAATVTINLTTAGDDFGDKLISTMRITERLP